MDLGLSGKTVIVTGGSRGIGAGTCEVFAREGANVVIDYRASADRAEALAERLRATYGVGAITVKADLCSEEDIVGLVRQGIEAFGGVDVLVNNAMVLNDAVGPIEDFDVEKFRGAEIGTIEAVMVACREFVAHCKSEGKVGHIVNVLTKSIFWTGSYGNLGYVTVKGANATFTRGLAHEVARDGIFVNAVVPGYVRNDRTEVDSERYQRSIKHIPMGRFAEPEEVGNCIAFLCSDKAVLCNGAILDCSGGTLNGD